MVLERIRASVKFMDCGNGKTCIDFSREGGSSMFFYSHFENIRSKMEEFIDATEDKVFQVQPEQVEEKESKAEVIKA